MEIFQNSAGWGPEKLALTLKLACLWMGRWKRDLRRSLPTRFIILFCTALGKLLFLELPGLSQVKILKRKSLSYSGMRLYIIGKLDIPVLLLMELKASNAEVTWRFNFSLEWGQVLLVPLRNLCLWRDVKFYQTKRPLHLNSEEKR